MDGPGGRAMTSTRVITVSRWRHGFEPRWGCQESAGQRPSPEGLEAFQGRLPIFRRSVALEGFGVGRPRRAIRVADGAWSDACRLHIFGQLPDFRRRSAGAVGNSPDAVLPAQRGIRRGSNRRHALRAIRRHHRPARSCRAVWHRVPPLGAGGPLLQDGWRLGVGGRRWGRSGVHGARL
jgi:hypothetical protein